MNVFDPCPDELFLSGTLSKEVVRAMAGLWGYRVCVGGLLGTWQNVVFALALDGQASVLRLIKSEARSKAAVEAECAWIELLARSGVKVARPLKSLSGQFVEQVTVGSDVFQAVAFERIAGKRLLREQISDCDSELIHNWGAVIGHMHRISAETDVSAIQRERMRWDQDELISRDCWSRKGFGAFGTEQLEAAWSWLSTLPETSDSFGLIHADLHGRNFLINDHFIKIFDFDDLQSHWFAYDLAVATCWACPERDARRRRFSAVFLAGYSEHFALHDEWLERLGKFIRLRLLLDYALTVVKRQNIGPTPALVARSSWLLRKLVDEQPFNS